MRPSEPLSLKSLKTSVAQVTLLILMTLTINACGGGGGGGDSAPASAGGSPTTAPSITTQPQSRLVNDGVAATFNVVATGTAPLTYQWKRNGSDIGGATSASYAITATTLADSGAQFTVIISNSAGSATSSIATLTVNAVAPTITTQPLAQTVLAGSSATFSVVAAGSGPLSFQWRKNGIAITGATNASYVTPVTSQGDSGAAFDVLVSNTAGNITSNAVLLSVTSSVIAPSVVSQPQSVNSIAGGSATFTVTAAGTAPFLYQWMRNGIDITGANTASLTVSPITLLNNLDSYTVAISNSAGNVVSNTATLNVATQAIDLLAGGLGGQGKIDGAGAAARLVAPKGMAADATGNIYFTDNGAIRKITPLGFVSTIAGNSGTSGYADGAADSAQFNNPTGLGIDSLGNIYVADRGNHIIRKISSLGIVSTFAGVSGNIGYANGVGNAASFDLPTGVAIDNQDNVYISDSGNSVIRKIMPDGTVTTFAGADPSGIVGGTSGSTDGTGNTARFLFPAQIAIDASNNLYVADWGNDKVRKISSLAVVSTLAGGVRGYLDGVGSAAQFTGPSGVGIDSTGNVYVTDLNNTIRKITSSGTVTTLAGSGILGSGQFADGVGTAAWFSHPYGLTNDGAGNIYVADTENHIIRKLTVMGAVSTWIGSKEKPGYIDGRADISRFNSPAAITSDPAGNIFVADNGNQVIRKVSITGTVTTFAGVSGQIGSNDGTGSSAQFSNPMGIASDSAGNIYVADTGNFAIRKITPFGVVSTIAGSAGQAGATDGVGTSARFFLPRSITVDSLGNIYVADTGNDTIRKITPTGNVSTLAGDASSPSGSVDGTGSAARFSGPVGIVCDSSGNIFVTDGGTIIRRITQSGVVTTVAGSAFQFGHVDGLGTTARFDGPRDIAVDTNGNLYVTDSSTIRKISPSSVVTTIAGKPITWQTPWGVTLGGLPGSFSAPWGITRLASASGVKLLITDENSILSVTLP